MNTFSSENYITIYFFTFGTGEYLTSELRELKKSRCRNFDRLIKLMHKNYRFGSKIQQLQLRNKNQYQ